MTYDTELTQTELRCMVEAVESNWRIAAATAAASEAGHHAVYNLDVETPEGVRECYLKATPEEKPGTLSLEARLLAIVGAQSDVPVSSVHGVVDEGDELRAPFVLMAAMPGEARSRLVTGSLPLDRHRALARDVGRHLAGLHAIDAVDAFGFLRTDDGTLRGDAPSGDPASVAVTDPTANWRKCLEEWATAEVDGLHGGRFHDLAPAISDALDDRIAEVTGPFEPVLARVDQSLENLLSTDGSANALLDWEFTIAATPAYDVVAVADSLTGGPYRHAPAVTDRYDAVLDAVCDGYATRDPAVVAQVRANRDCYELLATVRAMANLEPWYASLELSDQVDAAADALRAAVEVAR